MWLNILLIAILIVIAVYLFARRRDLISAPSDVATSSTDDELSGRMSGARLRIVVAYLLFLGLTLVYMEVSLLSLDFPDPTPTLLVSAPVEIPPPAQTTTTTASATTAADGIAGQPATPAPPPTILAAMPQPGLGTSSNGYLTVYGTNFSDKSQVRLNGRSAPTKDLSATSITASLNSADVVNGQVAIEVVDGGRISNGVILGLPLRKPKVELNVLNLWRPNINREVQLLLIIVFAGALGSYIHALKSATAFIGNGTMKESWFWWYVSGPFIGMAMALVFYCVLRGGFLAGTPADEKVVNPFGVLAVGALVGMFADKAALKLGEIFETLFKSGDPRGDRLNAPVIVSLDPNKLQAGSKQPQMVKIIGERLAKVTVVRIDSTEIKAEVLSDREVHFTLQPKDLDQPKTLKIAAVDAQGGASISATLAVVGPKITGPDPLPAATANQPYDQTFTASDCAGSCHWSLDGNAGGLTIDAATGKLTGTPATAGTTISLKVMVEDDNQQSDTKNFDLVVN